MDIERFTELAQAWGAQRSRWPQHEQALYDRCTTTAEGQSILAAAERVDLFLDAWQPDDGDDEERVARIVAAAGGGSATATIPALPAARRAGHRYATWLSTGLLGFAVLGFVFGFTQADFTDNNPAYTDMLFGASNMMEDFL